MLRLLLTLTVLSTLVSTQAVAASKPPPSARKHFLKGMRLYDKGRYQDAIDEFEASYKDSPHGVIRYNIAECYEKLGNLDAALQSYRDYLKQVPEADDREKVESLIAHLQTRVADRKQPLDLITDPPGAAIEVDGVIRGHAPLVVNLSVGLHHLTAELAGHDSVRRDVEVPPDAPVKVSLTLPVSRPPVPEARPLGPTETPLVAQSAPPLPRKRLLVGITAGITGATLIGGLLFGAGASGASKQLTGSQHPQPDVTHLYQTAKNDAVTANVLYVVAGVAAAASTTLFFVEGRF